MTNFFATQRGNVGTMLQPFETMSQHVAMMCCVKNRRCKIVPCNITLTIFLVPMISWLVWKKLPIAVRLVKYSSFFVK